MNIKSFRNLVQEKTGLSGYEYDQLFNALEEKYGVMEADIAGQIPEKLGFVDTDIALKMGLPNTADQKVTITMEDESLAEKLEIDPKIVAKVTQWGEAASERLESLDNMPFGVGNEIKEVIDKNGIDEFMGSQRDIAKAIDDRLAPAVENTVEGATADAQKDEKVSIWGNIKERFEGREVEDHTVTVETKYDYYNEDVGVALKGVGDNMRVYLINKEGEAQHIGSVPCAKEDRAEFVSEFNEKAGIIPENDNSFFNNKERIALGAAEAVSKDIAEEKEIGTGNFLTDKIRDNTQEKYDDLKEKIEKYEDKIEDMEDGKLKDMMQRILDKSHEELSGYEQQLEKFEQMEIENAKEIKLKVESAKAEIEEQMDKIDNMGFFSDEFKDKMKSSLEGQLDELNDRLAVVDAKLSTVENEGVAAETVAEGKADNEHWFLKFNEEVEDKIQDAKEWISGELADAKAASQTFVANVDNIVGEVKDDVATWANKFAQNEHVQNFSETVNNFYDNIQDDLQGIRDASKSLGKEISEDAGNLWADIKEAASDIYKDVDAKWDKAMDDLKEWGADIADKFGFDKDDDVGTSIDD